MMPDAVLLLRGSYLSAALLVLLISSIPPLRTRFLAYGPRAAKAKTEAPEAQSKSWPAYDALLDIAAKICVPHSWFTSFYAVSVSLSLFWASEVVFQGPAFRTVAQHLAHRQCTMSFEQVAVIWLMMFIQGSRRLYECLVLSAPSKSKMWIGHWALGILFYVATSVAVWVEGSAALQAHSFSTKDLTIKGPSIRTCIGILIFILASGVQHDCHAYLASLKKPRRTAKGEMKVEYRLPEHPVFNLSLTPHYFAECLIYLSLSILAAPEGEWLNWTLISALVFVGVNLGVTASGTRKWYESKFGTEAVKGRARMIPGLY
ncbi:unnamed protein product [Zymoseptoria tritici ST99CH_3D1]|nr:unnamed protein product [Zymoseptoria tritici ST99CH_3D1]